VSRRSNSPDPARDAIAERLVDVGRHLREARQQRGEDLYDVADYLRIKPSYLFALEEGELRSIPGQTYAMGFLRTYADHLGFDGAEVVRGLRATSAEEPADSLQIRQPVPENRIPSLGIVLLALLLAGFAYGGWFAAQSGGELFSQLRALPGSIGQHAARMFEEEDASAVVESASGAQVPERVAAGEATVVASAPAADAAPGPLSPAARQALTLAAEPIGSIHGSGAQDDTARRTVGQGGSLQAGELPATATASPPGPVRTTDITSAIAATASTDPAAPDAAVAGSAGAAMTDGAAASGDQAETLASLVLDAEAERDAALRRLEAERPEGGTVGDLLAGLELQADPAAAERAAAPVGDGTGRVVLVARAASWIQVQSPSRDFIRSLTLEAGERFEIPDRTDLALWTGNAGGLEVWVDGASVGVLGADGAVLRDVSLAPQALLEQR
jgi:cytoskeleton protein RodZ